MFATASVHNADSKEAPDKKFAGRDAAGAHGCCETTNKSQRRFDHKVLSLLGELPRHTRQAHFDS
jgi:hypothetical protein